MDWDITNTHTHTQCRQTSNNFGNDSVMLRDGLGHYQHTHTHTQCWSIFWSFQWKQCLSTNITSFTGTLQCKRSQKINLFTWIWILFWQTLWQEVTPTFRNSHPDFQKLTHKADPRSSPDSKFWSFQWKRCLSTNITSFTGTLQCKRSQKINLFTWIWILFLPTFRNSHTKLILHLVQFLLFLFGAIRIPIGTNVTPGVMFNKTTLWTHSHPELAYIHTRDRQTSNNFGNDSVMLRDGLGRYQHTHTQCRQTSNNFGNDSVMLRDGLGRYQHTHTPNARHDKSKTTLVTTQSC